MHHIYLKEMSKRLTLAAQRTPALLEIPATKIALPKASPRIHKMIIAASLRGLYPASEVTKFTGRLSTCRRWAP